MTVDEFIKKRVLPEHRATVQKLRQLMHELAPKTEEVVTYGILGWRGTKRIIAVISPTKKDITLAFARGASFEDRYGLLQGVGKVSKNLKFKDAKEIKKTVLAYYVKQALAFEAY